MRGFPKSQKSLFSSLWGFLQESIVSFVLFYLFINDLPASPPTSISYLLYAGHLAFCSLMCEGYTRSFDWSRADISTGIFFSIVTPLFLVDHHQSNRQYYFFFNYPLRFNPTPTFLGVIFKRTLPFSKHVSLLKAQFFHRLKAVHCISDFFKEPPLFCTKLFLGPFSLILHPNDILFVTNATMLKRLHRASSRAITGFLSCCSMLLLFTRMSLSPLLVTMTRFALSFY